MPTVSIYKYIISPMSRTSDIRISMELLIDSSNINIKVAPIDKGENNKI